MLQVGTHPETLKSPNGKPIMRTHSFSTATPFFVCMVVTSLFPISGLAQDNETDPVMLSAGEGVLEWRAPSGAIMFTTPAPVDGGVVVVDESSSVAWVVSQNDIVQVSTNRPYTAEVFVTVDTSTFFGDLFLTDGLLFSDDVSLVEDGAALCLDLNDGPPNIVNYSATVRIDLTSGAIDVGAQWSYEDEGTGEAAPAPCSFSSAQRPSPYATPPIRYDEDTCSVVLEDTGRTITIPRGFSDCMLTERGHSYRGRFTAVGVFIMLGDYGWEDLYFLDHSLGRLVALEPLRITTEEPVQWHRMNDMAIVGEHLVLLSPGPLAESIPYGTAWLY